MDRLPEKLTVRLSYHEENRSTQEDDSNEQVNNRETLNEGNDYHDSEALERFIGDSRSVIDQQIRCINQIKNHAAYALRLNILIFALILTITTIFLRTSESINELNMTIDSLNNPALWAGIGVSFISFLSGLWAYIRSTVKSGVSSSDIQTLLDQQWDYSEALRQLALGHKKWISTNAKINNRDARFLFISHISLFIAVGLYGLSIFWAVYQSNFDDLDIYLGIIALSAIFISLAIIPYTFVGRKISVIWKSTKGL